ncbi:MAG: GNAT family N-acetyltransferase [Bacteroidetes bacterium SW_9_63_38]|nr:MAG: GNAT family N-acetyltransferase [Bacteroidetes bacterium SW_9_63_38]
MTILPVRNEDGLQAARDIRRQVFVEEQGCDPDDEWDGHDETSRHVLGMVDDTPVATARWRTVPHGDEIVAKLERFAVLPGHRGEGHGTQLVEAVLDDARRAGFDTFLIHSQVRLEGWYAQLGFEPTGRRFEEAGLPHVEMLLQKRAAEQ